MVVHGYICLQKDKQVVKIYIRGNERRTEELKSKLDSGHEIISIGNEMPIEVSVASECEVVFDLNADEKENRISDYSSLENKLIIICAVKKRLKEMIIQDADSKNHFVGFNALPTFINRSILEVSFLNEDSKKNFTEFASAINCEWLEVKDETGMVTLRVIGMLINEACFSFNEGVASMEDIDKGMKLGTNYPYGPFEWCDRIGVKDVYETLLAIRNITNDERYAIAELLKKKYLSNESFYS